MLVGSGLRLACLPLPQARALFEAPEGAPHLLPFYARIAASLAQVFPDVAAPLLRYLEEEFAALQACCHDCLLHELAGARCPTAEQSVGHAGMLTLLVTSAHLR